MKNMYITYENKDVPKIKEALKKDSDNYGKM